MYTLISFADAVLVEAIVLSRGDNRMRVVLPGVADTMEIQRAGENWFTEKGETVEFQFLATASQPVSTDQARAAGKSSAGYAVI
jgi:hypothetical protein